MAKQKRDNAYYGARLEREHPAAYADFKAGRYRSLGEALLAVGITKPRPRVREMQNAWKNASKAEREVFIQWLNGELTKAAATGTTKAPPSNAASSTHAASATAGPVVLSRPALDKDRRLQRWTIARVEEILRLRKVKPGLMMQEMGYISTDQSLMYAMSRNSRLKKLDPARLEKWITDWSISLGLPL